MDIGRALPADVNRELLDELLSYKALYESLNRLVAEGVAELTAQGEIVRWNYAAETITGHSAQSLVGVNFRDLLDGGNLNELFDAPAGNERHRVSFRLRDTAGKLIELRGAASTLNSGDAIESWIVAFAPSRKIEEIEQLKNELVSTVSHELKTPLAAIKAYTATLLSNPTIYETQRTEYLNVIDQQTDRLSRLIDDMLLVTRVEAGQMLKRRVLISLDAILDRVFDQLTYDHAMYTIVRENTNLLLSGDPDRLLDIFSHVIENAVKYSPNGGTLSITAQQTTGQSTVAIRDGGIGIAEENLSYIFDRFYRVESELTSSVGGSGLGLFIVNALVRAHGGTITVRSELGVGTTMTLNLPVRP
ncbi:MAG: ATP-binding protein [Candidatus Eremiobacteraeota bacterium]|nr:ATP-binding protein [Candidatus Eremiobacteraeota bacterium]